MYLETHFLLRRRFLQHDCTQFWGSCNSISGLVLEYIVAIDVTRVRFPADAYCNARARSRNEYMRRECLFRQIVQAAIAQLGERQTEDLKVPGSIPGLGILGCGVKHKSSQRWLSDRCVNRSNLRAPCVGSCIQNIDGTHEHKHPNCSRNIRAAILRAPG